MKNILLLLIFILLTTSSKAQTFKGYTVLSEFKGDFDKNGQRDKIVVYEKLCENSNTTTQEGEKCRQVAIYMGKNNKYELFASNNAIIECSNCGGAGVGDPFQNITVKNEYFSIENLYGACDKTFQVITFKYDKKLNNFYLYKIGEEDYSCREEDNPNGVINVKKKTKTTKDFGVLTFDKYHL